MTLRVIRFFGRNKIARPEIKCQAHQLHNTALSHLRYASDARETGISKIHGTSYECSFFTLRSIVIITNFLY